MSLAPNLHWFAAIAFERILYCLSVGMVLAVLIWMVMRLIPAKNSRTRFAVWFSTLLAVAVMPMLVFKEHFGFVLNSGDLRQHPLFTIPASWAEYVALAWAVFTLAGLVRVAVGVWQIGRLRRGCVELDLQMLSTASQERVAALRQRRPVSLLVSTEVEVPTALGFLRPAIVIPVWLTDESATTELDHVLLHELAHLQRWDDWTNLAQKLVRAVLFFHPAVWWIERKLSLDREMACDDAVLAHSASPRVYAECLTRVAEKSFLRRQLALAQAAVHRVRQLSQRVTHILDSSRGADPARLWKPALPTVAVVAALCAISMQRTPELIRLQTAQPASALHSSSQLSLAGNAGEDAVIGTSISKAALPAGTVNAVPVRALENRQNNAWSSISGSGSRSYLPAGATPVKHVARPRQPKPLIRARYNAPSETSAPAPVLSAGQSVATEETAGSSMIVLVVASGRITSSGLVQWQVRTWELQVMVPASHTTKQTPRKT